MVGDDLTLAGGGDDLGWFTLFNDEGRNELVGDDLRLLVSVLVLTFLCVAAACRVRFPSPMLMAVTKVCTPVVVLLVPFRLRPPPAKLPPGEEPGDDRDAGGPILPDVVLATKSGSSVSIFSLPKEEGEERKGGRFNGKGLLLLALWEEESKDEDNPFWESKDPALPDRCRRTGCSGGRDGLRYWLPPLGCWTGYT